MGFGDTAKKLQKVAEMAEDVYAKLKELREEVNATRETVEETAARTTRLETELAEQRALVAQLLEEQGVDPESVDLSDAEPPVGEADDGGGDASADGGAGDDATTAGAN
jgi:DNA repair ATPase RecN